MKKYRPLLITLGVVGLLLIMALGALYQPRVQTAMVRRVLADQPGLESSLEEIRVRAGFIEVTNLVIRHGALSARIPALRADVPVWHLLRDSPHIDRVVASGWEVQWDGSTVAPEVEVASVASHQVVAGWTAVLASGGGSPEIPPDILAQFSAALGAPVPVSVGELALKGRASWREAGPGADGWADVSLNGAGPTPGKSGQLEMEIKATSAPSQASRIQSLNIQSTLTTELTGEGRLLVAELATRLSAGSEGEQDRQVYGLGLELDQREGFMQVGLALSEAETDLFRVNLAATSAASLLQGEWSIAVSDDSVRNLMLGREIPSFQLSGAGELRATSALDELNVAGDVDFQVLAVAQLAQALAGVGDLSGKLGFEVRHAQGATRFTRLELDVAGAAPVLAARLLQGIEIGEDGAELRVEQPEDPVISCHVLGLPLSWLQPVIEPWVIDARPIEGELVGMVTAQGLRFGTRSPIRIEGAAVAKAGKSYVDEIDIEIDLGSEITTEGWQVELERVELAADGRKLLTLQARGGRLKRDNDIIKMVGRMDADLAMAGSLPGVEFLSGLSQGRLHAEFGVGVQERLSIATAVVVTDLRDQAGLVLPDIDLDGRIDLLPEGKVELHLPVHINAPKRASEITLNLRAEPVGAEWGIEGSLSGTRVYFQDVQALTDSLSESDSAAVSSSESWASGPVLSPVQAAASAPVWAGIQGTLQTALGEIVMPDGPSLRRLKSDITVRTDAVEVKNFSLTVGEGGQVEAQGQLAFDAAQPKPYRGEAQVTAKQVAVDPWLRWMEPETAPVFEGKVDLEATWQAALADLGEISEGGEFNAHVTSTSGVLRALGVDVGSYVQTGQTVAALGALFGAVTGNQRIAQQAQMVQSVTNAAERLSLVTFDQFNLNIERLANGDVILSDLSLIAPALRMIGEGKITYRDELAFWFQPFALTLNLSARDDLAGALQKLGLVKTQADPLGYLPLVSDFTLDGSLAKIGTTELKRLLVRALTSAK